MKILIKILLLSCLLISSARADLFHILNSDEDALQSRVDLIQQAKEELLICYFIFEDDKTSMQFLSLLRQAARRGVKVRMIIDAYFNNIPKNILKHMSEEGVEIKNYAPFNLLRPRHLLRRMHNKILVADNDKLITGGRNIQDAYYGLEKESHNYFDRDVLVSGKSANTSREYFNELWVQKFVKFPKLKKISIDQTLEGLTTIDEALLSLEGHPFVKLNTHNTWNTKKTDMTVEFIHDPIKKKRGGNVYPYLLNLINTAKKSIFIDTPYLVMPRRVVKAFRDARARGVSIRIMTNSLASTDAIFSQSAYINSKKNLYKMGVEVWEYLQYKSMHMKSFVFDDNIAIIGSYNFNGRSAKKDTEVIAVVEDPIYAKELKDNMDSNLQYAHKLDKKGRLIGIDKKFPQVKKGKLIITQILRFLVAPWAKLNF
jgi:putative cardiolipin synthase